MARYSRRKFMAAGAALAAAPLMARGGPTTQPATSRKPVTVTITISKGGIVLDPCRVGVAPGDGVEWICKGHVFAVHFLGVSPINEICLQSTKEGTIAIYVPEKGLAGCFSYVIAGFDGGMIWTTMADIIIPPKPGGGGGGGPKVPSME